MSSTVALLAQSAPVIGIRLLPILNAAMCAVGVVSGAVLLASSTALMIPESKKLDAAARDGILRAAIASAGFVVIATVWLTAMWLVRA